MDPTQFDRHAQVPVLRKQFPNRKILIHISNFRPVKRVVDVVRIFARVRSEIDAVLVMVGDGPDRVDAVDEARKLGVENDVQFLGRIDDIAPLLASADLFLLPSNRESFGLSALEALSCGVPVVGCNVGGLPEVVRDGETGALRAPGDIVSRSAAAIAILTDNDRWQAMSTLAAADARARFSEDAIVPLYEALYRKAVADRPRPASARPVSA
jgi:N-acetyl-alpha-D-glucosaminyl L-malate synthase BshA